MLICLSWHANWLALASLPVANCYCFPLRGGIEVDEITLFYLVRSATDNQTLDSSAEFGSTCSSESVSSQMKTI